MNIYFYSPIESFVALLKDFQMRANSTSLVGHCVRYKLSTLFPYLSSHHDDRVDDDDDDHRRLVALHI